MPGDLDDLYLDFADDVLSLIEDFTDITLASDPDICKAVTDLRDLLLDKFSEVQAEVVEGDTEYHGDMDTFAGEE